MKKYNYYLGEGAYVIASNKEYREMEVTCMVTGTFEEGFNYLKSFLGIESWDGWSLSLSGDWGDDIDVSFLELPELGDLVKVKGKKK